MAKNWSKIGNFGQKSVENRTFVDINHLLKKWNIFGNWDLKYFCLHNFIKSFFKKFTVLCSMGFHWLNRWKLGFTVFTLIRLFAGMFPHMLRKVRFRIARIFFLFSWTTSTCFAKSPFLLLLWPHKSHSNFFGLWTAAIWT